MQGLSHILNIGTLATWLSVAGLGSVAVFAPERVLPPVAVEPTETRLFEEDFNLGEPSPVENVPSEATATPESPPAPPELPDLTEFTPLPEIPEIPVLAPAPTAAPRPAAPVTPIRRNPEARPRPSTGRTSASSSSSSSNSTGTTASSGTGGMSQSSRLAAGRMPPPSYPAEAKRKNQTGTVLIEFTVDTDGRVISAHAKSSSGWPLLDSEAVRTVRRWKFPAGSVMKLQRPIVFQLR